MAAPKYPLRGRLRRLLERESRLAREDDLTGLCNRREFHDQGRHLLALAAREGIAISAVFIDLDRFKEVNDTLRHETGDTLLKVVADEPKHHLRASDLAGRLGGDEFALLLPGMDAAAAQPWCEELRQRLLTAMATQRWPVTFSIGVASFAQAPATLAETFLEVDRLMYRVKHSGRDRILAQSFPSASPPAASKSEGSA